MVAAPGAATPIPRRTDLPPLDEPTAVIALVPPTEDLHPEPATTSLAVPEPGPSLVRPLLTYLVPALLLALIAEAVAGRELAPYLGAAIGAAGAAVGLWRAIRA